MTRSKTHILAFLGGILLTVLLIHFTDCGTKTVYVPELDSAKARAYIEVGKREVLSQKKTEADSLRAELAHADSLVKARYTLALSRLPKLPQIEGIDSLRLIQALVNDNRKCYEVVMVADTLIRGYEIQLMVANSRMAIDDSLEQSLLRERLELKKVIGIQDAQIRELSDESWWEKHKFELGFISGAAITTAAFILR